MSYTISNKDITEWARVYKGQRFHALLTDCPYEYGFMGKSWDNSGISFQSETWAAVSDHLYPGAFCMTYGGARTWHRIAVAIEDAGFIIHPTIFAWIYSSGFPKATRIDTQLDKIAGVDREVIGIHPNPASEIFKGGKLDRRVELTAAGSDESAAWEGHRYGLQALKPAVEPVILFQKPYDKKSVESIAEYGAGALDIDGSRVPYESKWPSNLVLAHHPLCSTKKCHDDCNVSALGDNAVYFKDTTMIAETMEPANVIYSSKPGNKERRVGTDGTNTHVTVKPIDVNKYLASMLLPPQAYAPRRLLVPFSGVASEVIGGMLAGWEHVLGVELSREYAEIGMSRVHWWKDMMDRHGRDVSTLLSLVNEETKSMQLRMEL